MAHIGGLPGLCPERLRRRPLKGFHPLDPGLCRLRRPMAFGHGFGIRCAAHILRAPRTLKIEQ